MSLVKRLLVGLVVFLAYMLFSLAMDSDIQNAVKKKWFPNYRPIESVSTEPNIDMIGILQNVTHKPTVNSVGFSNVPHNAYDAKVIKVIDGDTIRVTIDLLPGLQQTITVRIDGIDTPEKGSISRTAPGHARCEVEYRIGQLVKGLTTKYFMGPNYTRVQVRNITRGKYANRLLGEIWVQVKDYWFSWEDFLLKQKDIETGLPYAVQYHGKTKRNVWCDGI